MNASVSPTFVAYGGPTNVTLTYRISTSNGLGAGLYWLRIVPTCEVALLAYAQSYSEIGVIDAAPISCYYNANGPAAVCVVGISNMSTVMVPVGSETH